MKLRIEPLGSYEQTVQKIWSFADNYWPDLIPWADYTLGSFFRHVHSLPYHADPDGVEFVTRPGLTVEPGYAGYRDCDDKAVLLLGWARARYVQTGEKNFPRIVVAGKEEDRPHHVYVEFLHGGRWLPAEGTYPEKGGLGVRLWPEKFRRVFGYGEKNEFFG